MYAILDASEMHWPKSGAPRPAGADQCAQANESVDAAGDTKLQRLRCMSGPDGALIRREDPELVKCRELLEQGKQS